jgi:cell division protein FtsI/penicillin-binding protein 2
MTTTDLGFTYASQPGSTAKLATSIASFNKLGLAAADKKFNVATWERIRTKGMEPDETGVITLERAVAKSNNVYFIKLANQEHLEEDMATVYKNRYVFTRRWWLLLRPGKLEYRPGRKMAQTMAQNRV